MSKSFFNKAAENWDQRVDHDKNKIKKVIYMLPDFDSPKILDVGSGTGVLIPFLQDKYNSRAQITEIDFAASMINKAQEKYSHFQNINFITGDIYKFPLPENNYDLIICYSVFPHFEDQTEILDRFYSLLKNNGKLLIFHSQSRDNINKMHQETDSEVKTDHLPPAQIIEKEAQKAGLTSLKSIDNQEIYLVIMEK